MKSAGLALIHTAANRQLIVTCCEAAREAGVRAGMSLAQGRALCPGLVHAHHDPARDAKALEALARWMMRFTPVVQPVHEVSGIFLEVTGTQRLYGSLEKLLRGVQGALDGFGIRARLAIAPTPGGAWALTYCAEKGLICETREALVGLLSPLAPYVLRLDEDILAKLHHLGLERVEQLLALPRDLLPARFGPQLLQRIDQATGRLHEPLTPLIYTSPIRAEIEFDGVVDSLESLWAAFGELIDQVTAKLIHRGAGAQKLTIVFKRSYSPPVERQIELSAASRNPHVFFNLIRCAMETLEEKGAEGASRGRNKWRKGRQTKVSFHRSTSMLSSTGFTGLVLAVPVYQTLNEEQIFLLRQEEHLQQQDFSRLIERLRIRLGDETLLTVQAVESHIPEKSYRLAPYAPGRRKVLAARENPVCGSRPLHLFAPREIKVLVRPSHDRDGAPIAFTLDGETRSLVHAIGPERIAGEWWTGHNKTRDYFEAEDDTGRRWWLFRVAQTSRWFLQGEYE